MCFLLQFFEVSNEATCGIANCNGVRAGQLDRGRVVPCESKIESFTQRRAGFSTFWTAVAHQKTKSADQR